MRKRKQHYDLFRCSLQLISGLAVITMAVTLGNPNVLFPGPHDRATMGDNLETIRGADKIHSFRDTLKWFGGTKQGEPSWIYDHPGVRAYRPLSSYFLLGQVRLGQRFGYRVTDFVNLALWGICCLLVTALTYRLTHSYPLSIGTGVLAAPLEYWFPLNHNMLLWFANDDNFLSIGCILASMVLFLLWRETGKAWHFAGCAVCSVASVLCKEWGFITPAMLLALSLLPAQVSRRRALLHAGALLFVAAGMYVARGVLVPGARPAPERLTPLLHFIEAWTPPAPLEILAMDGIGALKAIAGYAMASGACWIVWRNRAALRLIVAQESVLQPLRATGVLWLCVGLAYAPALGYDFNLHYGYLAMLMKCVFMAVAVQLAYRFAQSSASSFRSCRRISHTTQLDNSLTTAVVCAPVGVARPR